MSRRRKITSAKTNPQTISMTSILLSHWWPITLFFGGVTQKPEIRLCSQANTRVNMTNYSKRDYSQEFRHTICNGSTKQRSKYKVYRPYSLCGHVESQENKKLCFCTARLALNSRVGEASRAKTKLFILLRFNMTPEWERSIGPWLIKQPVMWDF